MTAERWEKVGKLYEEASELPPKARVAFLEQACAGDKDLRHEVEAMLAAEAYVGDFIAEPALKDAAGLLASHAPGALIGKKLSHYELLSFLGAGGMGEVYTARDTRLGRRVAIKLLPAMVARDGDRLRRFEQEARAIGMLNHPNILTIHDIGTHEEAPFIVSELLEGGTLRVWLKDKTITQRKAVDFALQMARGLAAAHERGIVHRDLKPENVFITKDERVKILDFGLAKLVQLRGNGSKSSSASPLVHTVSGIVMGTVGYMSPEQVRGDETDHRADIFAFGVILYEMFAGTPPFRGDSAVETMNAILKTETPELPASLREQSPGLERIIHRCLEKRPERRFQSANDLGFALETLTAAGWSGTPSERQRAAAEAWPEGKDKPGLLSWLYESRLDRASWLGWLAAGILALTTGALALAYFRQPAVEAETIRLTIAPPEKINRMAEPTISPDGRRLAFVASTEGNRSTLWLRPLGSLTAQPLPGTEGASLPFWAPDGKSLGFFAQGKLKKITLSGEPPVTLCDAPSPRGGTWGSNGVILFVPHPNAGVQRVSVNGGAPIAVATPDTTRQESNHLWPAFLPDGHHFLYLVTGQQPEEAGIYVASLDQGERRRLLAASSNALYAGPGYLLFARDRTLLAQPFDANKQQVSGEAVRLVEQIPGGPSGKAGFSVSDNGMLVHSASIDLNNQQLGWFDRAGKSLGSIGTLGSYVTAELSPMEDRVAVTRIDRQTRTFDIWLLDLASGSDFRFTYDPASDVNPLWSPDGSRIVWLSMREGAPSFYQKPVNGAGQAELLYRSDHQKVPTDWSDDGRFLLFQDNDPKTKWDIWVLPLEGERKPVPFAQTQYNESNGHLSPDGRWIAYTADETGTNEVYVQAFQPNDQTEGGKWQISAKGGDRPSWRRDGKELFYLTGGKLMSVEVKGGAGFQIGTPKELFDMRSMRAIGGSIAPDGKRILLVTIVEELNVTPFTIVLNWTAEMRK
jgi:eukaryotic-like serine/threonine-protein kinase